VKCNRLQRNPILGFERCKMSAPQVVVLDEGRESGPEWQALYEHADKGLRPILLTLYQTAMRPAECFAMRWEWIKEIAPGFWTIEPPPDMEKTGARRTIPVSACLRDALQPLQKDTGLVFPSCVTEKERHGIAKAFRIACERAGLQGLHPYCLRRTRISIWDARDSEACRFAVGHAARDVHAKHYLRITHERLFQLVGMEYNPALQFRLISKVG